MATKWQPDDNAAVYLTFDEIGNRIIAAVVGIIQLKMYKKVKISLDKLGTGCHVSFAGKILKGWICYVPQD